MKIYHFGKVFYHWLQSNLILDRQGCQNNPQAHLLLGNIDLNVQVT